MKETDEGIKQGVVENMVINENGMSIKLDGIEHHVPAVSFKDPIYSIRNGKEVLYSLDLDGNLELLACILYHKKF